MEKYNVTFIQYHTYSVEAENENEAEDIAYELFEKDMSYPVANIFYDEVEIE